MYTIYDWPTGYTLILHKVDHFNHKPLMISNFYFIYPFAGDNKKGKYLTWRERLNIALESAQGNYLNY